MVSTPNENVQEHAYKVTTHGRSVMAACMAHEKPLQITRVAFGSGKVDKDVNLADVHELLEYVTDGAVNERRHEDDRFFLTIQYANLAHPDVKMFILSEFIVYTVDPDTKEETDLIYGTLGDYRQPVPAYNPAYPPSYFEFPLELIISDEVNISVAAPAGIVTYDKLIKLMNSRAAGASQTDIIIPASGWAPDTDTHGAFAYRRDIASTDIREDMIPSLAVYPQSLEIAGECCFCQDSQTLPGLLRVYAKSIPKDDIRASLILFDTVPQHSGLSSSAVVARVDIEIPTDGWEDNDEADVSCAFRIDIPNIAVESDLYPMLAIIPEHLEAAGNCGISQNIRTLSGALRVYTDYVPEIPIQASLALLGTAQSITGSIIPDNTGEGGDAYALPIAGRNRLGVMKVGDGLIAAADGTVSVKPVTSEQVANIFKSTKTDSNG
ncbi:MAG: hypothetical protein K2O18_16360 [Oscillospiraceae bacterium]|nr:hypothetical protein [Oscillospiraceae bacterium]